MPLGKWGKVKTATSHSLPTLSRWPPSSLAWCPQDWVQLARYGHLPVGNLGGDWLLDIADAHFARCLRDAGHLLWITDPSLPDVASRGDDDATEDLLLSADPVPLEVHGNPMSKHCKTPWDSCP